MQNSLPHNHSGGHLSHIRTLLAKTDHFHAVSQLFAQLADPTRMRIFWLLCHREECVVNISALLEMSSPAVSHHLKVLRECGLLESRRDGKEVYYTAADTPACQLLHKTVEQIMDITCPPTEITSSEDIARLVHAFLLEHLQERITIEELSEHFHINTTTLKECFKQVYGDSIAAHIHTHRMEAAAGQLLHTSDSIAQIAQNVGFQSQSRFTAAFKKTFGMLPSTYRKGEYLPEDGKSC